MKISATEPEVFVPGMRAGNRPVSAAQTTPSKICNCALASSGTTWATASPSTPKPESAVIHQ